MANQPTAQTQPKPAPPKSAEGEAHKGGRPAKNAGPKLDPITAAKKNLKYAMDRANSFIHDGGSSYARRARGAARAGVPKEIVLRGVVAMEEAIHDLRGVIERSYAEPQKKAKAPVVSRADF